MRNLIRALTVLLALHLAVGIASGATAIDFYLNLLRRGVGDYNAGRFAAAAGELRIGAFGLLDHPEQYQTALIYLALSADKMGQTEEVHRAVGRLLTAQRIDPRYMALSIPADVRTAFEALVQRTRAADLPVLRRPAPPRTATPPPATPPPSAVATPPPAEVRPEASPPAPAPATTTAATATTTTITFPEPTTTNPPGPAVPNPTPTSTTTASPTATAPDPTPASTTTTPPQQPATHPATSNQQPVPPPRPAPPATDDRQPATRRSLSTADRALETDDLLTARAIYREHLEATGDRATLIRVAEGLYRARDFAGALRAFEKAGALRAGEEPYRYYIAVSLYETGRYAQARNELAAALPHIEITPDVARYRAKIEGAID